jgi:Cu/Ag efflux protein CusF
LARTAFAILAVAFACCIASHSAGGKDSSPATAPASQPAAQSIDGVVHAVDKQTLTVTVEGGNEQLFSIDADTVVTRALYVCVPAARGATARKRVEVPAAQSDLKVGQRVVINAEQQHQRATKIQIDR